MMTIASNLFITVLFGLMGCVGPLVRWLTWPPSAFEQNTWSVVSTFVYDLVFLLWPTQSLAVIEVNSSTAIVRLVAVGSNILLFSIVGVLASFLAKKRRGLIALYVGLGLLLTLFSLWGAGFNLLYFNAFAYFTALLLYAVPFGLTARVMR